MSYHFNSRFEVGPEFGDFDQAAVKNEPMLFNCDFRTAYEIGGPITRAFLDAIECDGYGGIIDTRVHMLMPVWFPCIPGWHHDDVPRSRPDGQPNYESPEHHTRHVMGLVILCRDAGGRRPAQLDPQDIRHTQAYGAGYHSVRDVRSAHPERKAT